MNAAAEINDLSANTWILTKPVLKAGELTGSLDLLGPRAERTETTARVERVLYVAQGVVTVEVGSTNYILNTDETLHIAADRSAVLRNHGLAPAKVFTLALPARRHAEAALVFPN